MGSVVKDRDREGVGAGGDGTIAFLLLRLFFAQFWFLQFFGKLFDQESHILAWKNLAIWSAHTTEWFVKQTILPAWFVAPYTRALPYCELTISLCLLTGVATRRTLIASALLLISLDAGMLLQLKHDVVALNTVYFLAILLALRWERHNRWTFDEFLGVRPPIRT